MELQLDSKFKITVDSSKQNFQLEKLEDIQDRKTKEIKYEYRIIGYFGHNLSSVLKRYRDEVLLDEGKLDAIDRVLDKFKELEQVINRVVKRENIKMAVKDDQ